MTAVILPKPVRELLVIGPIYNRLDKLPKIEELAPQYDWIIFNSGLCYPNDDLKQIKNRIEVFKQWAQNKNVIYVNGRYDLLLLGRVADQEMNQWIRSNCNVVIADFSNRTIVIADGGIPDSVKTRYDLLDNLEVSFVSRTNEKPWHQSYNGRLGYVISNSPLSDKSPQYYNYSMQLGTLYGPQTAIYAQEVDGIGLKRTILL